MNGVGRVDYKREAQTTVREIKAILSATKESGTIDQKRVRNALKRAVHVIEAHLRRFDDASHHNKINLMLVQEEMTRDLIDREANAAKREERQRLLFERPTAQNGQLNAHDRASASARYAELAIASLCPHTSNRPAPGCEELCNRNAS
jgi:hypothetical protein